MVGQIDESSGNLFNTGSIPAGPLDYSLDPDDPMGAEDDETLYIDENLGQDDFHAALFQGLWRKRIDKVQRKRLKKILAEWIEPQLDLADKPEHHRKAALNTAVDGLYENVCNILVIRLDGALRVGVVTEDTLDKFLSDEVAEVFSKHGFDLNKFYAQCRDAHSEIRNWIAAFKEVAGLMKDLIKPIQGDLSSTSLSPDDSQTGGFSAPEDL